MNEVILFALLAIVIVGFAIVVFVLNARLKDLKSNSTVDFLKADMTELTRGVASLQQAVGDKLERNSQSMQTSMQKQLSETTRGTNLKTIHLKYSLHI